MRLFIHGRSRLQKQQQIYKDLIRNLERKTTCQHEILSVHQPQRSITLLCFLRLSSSVSPPSVKVTEAVQLVSKVHRDFLQVRASFWGGGLRIFLRWWC